MTDYKTCTHLYDDGNRCGSAALTNRDYCSYHLRYRGRLMRRAQYRARHQRYDITLPPLDSLCSIQSALSEIAEALAADMIDPRRAQALLKLLRMSRENLKDGLKDDNAHWHDTPYRSESTAAYDRFEADYGLPEGIDLKVAPELAFPPTHDVILSEERSDESKDPYISAEGLGRHGYPNIDRPPLIPVIPPPVLRDYVAEAEIAMTEVTPQDLELNEIMRTEGLKAMESRALEHERDANRKRRRKLYRANYERYVAEAKMKNIQRAAEKLLAQRQAAEQAAAAQEVGCPIPPSVGGVGLFPDTTKKPPVSAARDNIAEKKEEAIA